MQVNVMAMATADFLPTPLYGNWDIPCWSSRDFDAVCAASDSSVAAEKAVVHEASVLEESVTSSEAEAIAQNNIKSVKRDSPVAAVEGLSSERKASIVEEQNLRDNELEKSRTLQQRDLLQI